MTKTIVRRLTKMIHHKREQLVTIREDVEDLLDYLEVLKARARDEKKPRLTHAQLMKIVSLSSDAG